VQDDRISIELGLSCLVVLDVREERFLIEALVEYRPREAEYPRCGRPAFQVHQRHLQRKRNAKVWRK
jgi:hypothetical protein